VTDLRSWEELRALMLGPKPPISATAFAIGKDPLKISFDGAWTERDPGWVRSTIEPRHFAYLQSADGRVLRREETGRPAIVVDVEGLRREGGPTMRLWIDEETGCILRMERLDDPAPLLVLQDVRVGRVEPPVSSEAPPS